MSGSLSEMNEREEDRYTRYISDFVHVQAVAIDGNEDERANYLGAMAPVPWRLFFAIDGKDGGDPLVLFFLHPNALGDLQLWCIGTDAEDRATLLRYGSIAFMLLTWVQDFAKYMARDGMITGGEAAAMMASLQQLLKHGGKDLKLWSRDG